MFWQMSMTEWGEFLRVGGDPKNFRNCYLKYNIPDIDPALVPTTHIGHTLDDVKYPEVTLPTLL